MLKIKNILPVAQSRLVTVKHDALLIDTAKLLHGPRSNLVIVCDEQGKIAGVITKTDVVDRISRCTGCSCRMAAADVMTVKVTLCKPEDRLDEVWASIKQHNLKNIPVVDEASMPLGVLNARDAVQALLEDVEYEEKLLRDYVMGVGYR